MDTNTVQVIEAFGNKLDGYIGVIAEKAGVATEHFWPVFVRQQVIEGWFYLGLIVLISIMCVMTLRRACQRKANAEDDDAIRGACAAAGMVFGIFMLLVLCFEGANVATKLLNPEYAAMQELIRMIKYGC